ncbi:ribosome recycling factor [Wolinella succinogenes]|uniref:Ribosome-recycling factor n=1 Tax=Wolinella succinogenes (strain ATCC 29543 / DSM 1740 / CCUG 13145 / JCM 31913 / LMG 7466 / NCTC 11488 / FDC 602W) TaxID=273121 RepID=RRF_WOLSU|nr:ribosome recycling factor [Wolinella succinogenes]Q7MAD8.1 RecName: Full=Ribosome-recycling factor; Short=RRF; AltName: Full=Ribosome-releasing factor [Wolinella succinogenes DSM 1740]HCZ19889.1 ribosome-recycling factor [Helicobacter sp.]NLU35055.1 ribosome recycling factor [Wolinella succinogenes]CAE09465.1 RIBOSOME RECYCLING FACTOR [Wolinella succinogenes]VEG81678.1 Ribosome-releasing factor [Wolinella succinogenes]
MELNEVYQYTKEHMEKTIDAMKRDFATLRTGKVSTAIVEPIRVDYYGTPTPLSQVGSVIASDATTLVISPWEKNLLKGIEKAIQEANIGVNPNNDGDVIKLFFPPMTSEQRKEIAKDAKALGEKAKVAVRNIRKESNDKIKKLEKDKLITEDQSKKAHDEVQKYTDDYVKKIDDMVKSKEEEILKV